MDFEPSASASGVAHQGERILDSEAEAGDWVLYNWDGDQNFGPGIMADHIGVLEWTDINGSGLFGAVEGNTGYSYGGEVARVTRNNNTYYATAFFRPPYSSTPEDSPHQIPGSALNDRGLWYSVHVQDVGWCDWVHDGQVAGTTGYAKRMEAIKVNPPEGVEMIAKAHIQNDGWKIYRNIVHGNDIVIGTTGQAKRLEMLSFEVVKSPAGFGNFDFRAHQQDVGWKGWTPSGYATGTDGQAIRLEALQMRFG